MPRRYVNLAEGDSKIPLTLPALGAGNYYVEAWLMQGNKVVEIKSSNVNKGRAAMRMIARKKYDFIFAIGDDWTDEFMFQELPEEAITVKVGRMKTHARYFLDGIGPARELLRRFGNI